VPVGERRGCRTPGTRSNQRKAIEDLGANLVRLHRLEMMGGESRAGATAQAAANSISELRLAEQQDLQKGMRPELKTGEHAQLVERLDERFCASSITAAAAAAGTGFLMQKPFDQRERTGLVLSMGCKPESTRGHVDQFLAVQPAGDDICGGQALAVDRGEPMSARRADLPARPRQVIER